mgnify:CR=1 FL=1
MRPRAMTPQGTLKRLATGAVVSLALVAAGALAQEYPARAIRIVTSPAGGGNDFPARIVARGISAPLGQQVVVDNRPTNLLADLVAKAAPDGYTLLVTGSAHWLGPLLEKVSYDPIGDFAAISLLDRSPTILVVHPSLPVKSVRQMIAFAKARPGGLNVAVGGVGTSNYIAAILFNHLAGVNLVRVPYKGTGPAMTAVMSGEVEAIFATPSGAAPHMKSGRLRGLATGSARPSALARGLPTLAESGLPGYEYSNWYGFVVPAKTPRAIIQRLNKEFTLVLKDAEVRDKLVAAGMDPAPSSPEELQNFLPKDQWV